jgi:hypothetical protein
MGGAFIAVILGMIGLASTAFGAYDLWLSHPTDLKAVPAEDAGFIVCGILLTMFAVRFFVSALRSKVRATFDDRSPSS